MVVKDEILNVRKNIYIYEYFAILINFKIILFIIAFFPSGFKSSSSVAFFPSDFKGLELVSVADESFMCLLFSLSLSLFLSFGYVRMFPITSATILILVLENLFYFLLIIFLSCSTMCTLFNS